MLHSRLLSPDELVVRLTARYADLIHTAAWGERALFYNPAATLPHGIYFVTLKLRDSANDAASALDHRSAYRMNVGLVPARYTALFGPRPARPTRGGVVRTGHDFAALDQLTPHPVYAWMGWAAVVNPSRATLEALWPVLDESYADVQRKFAQRTRGTGRAAVVGARSLTRR